MNIATSARIAVAVLATTIAVRSMKAQQSAPTASRATAAAVRVPKSVLERYVGEYVYPSGVTAVVRLRGDTLIREVGGQETIYTPISDTRFTMGAFVHEFLIDRAGGVTTILSDGVGTEIRIARKASGAAAATPPSATLAAPTATTVRVPRSVLARYVGEYIYSRVGPPITIVVRLKGDTLTRQIADQPEVVLLPVSETMFKVGGTSLMTEFVIDRAGGVTQVMGSGDQQRLAVRKPRADR